jgi:DNA polymerase-3 subunit delta'
MLYPRQTSSLIGRASQVEKIKEAYCQSRLPQGILLYGPKGVGKATFAYHIARYLFQDVPNQFFVDEEDPLFKRVAASAHGDLFVVERSLSKEASLGKEIPVEEVRNALSFLKKSPLEGGFRVVIIDSVNEMNKNASNALLKSLEEPPQKTLIILIHHGGGGILPTLKSRCHRLFCPPLSKEDSLQVLKNNLGCSSEDFELLTHFAKGAPGNILAFFNAFEGAEIFKGFVDILGSLKEKNFSKVQRFIDYLLSQKNMDSLEAASFLVSWWVDRLCLFATSSHVPEAFVGEKEVARHFLTLYSLKSLPQSWQNIQNLLKEARIFNLDARHVLVCTFSEFLINKH